MTSDKNIFKKLLTGYSKTKYYKHLQPQADNSINLKELDMVVISILDRSEETLTILHSWVLTNSSSSESNNSNASVK